MKRKSLDLARTYLCFIKGDVCCIFIFDALVKTRRVLHALAKTALEKFCGNLIVLLIGQFNMRSNILLVQ